MKFDRKRGQGEEDRNAALAALGVSTRLIKLLPPIPYQDEHDRYDYTIAGANRHIFTSEELAATDLPNHPNDGKHILVEVPGASENTYYNSGNEKTISNVGKILDNHAYGWKSGTILLISTQTVPVKQDSEFPDGELRLVQYILVYMPAPSG